MHRVPLDRITTFGRTQTPIDGTVREQLVRYGFVPPYGVDGPRLTAVVRRTADADERFELVEGHVLVAVLASMGWHSVPATVLGPSGSLLPVVPRCVPIRSLVSTAAYLFHDAVHITDYVNGIVEPLTVTMSEDGTLHLDGTDPRVALAQRAGNVYVPGWTIG